MKLLTLEDYEKAGEHFWSKYWYVATQLGQDAKTEDILKVMESLGTVAMKIREDEEEEEKEKIGPFGFNKKKEESDVES